MRCTGKTSESRDWQVDGPRGGVGGSTERERERLDAGIEELNFELTSNDRRRLPDQLIQTRLHHRPIAGGVSVYTVSRTRRLAVERDAKTNRHGLPSGAHHEMHVARAEAVVEPSVRGMQRNQAARDHPLPDERPH